jgi:sugar phosphate isomerase/epimerase
MTSERRGEVSRRDFIRLGAASAASLALGGLKTAALAAAEAARKKIPIALQLYSVRDDCAKDLPAVLAAVAKMGYVGVEFTEGIQGRDAEKLRKLLEENNLKCCGTHTGLGTILGDELKKTVEFHKTIGNKFLIVPGLPEEYNKSKEGWLKAAKIFDEAAEKVKPEGMYVGYHNHSHEFKALDGELPWDTFFGNTRPEVVMQMDSGNCMAGGGDPLAFLKK